MRYCGYHNLTQLWFSDGINLCAFETFTLSAIAIFLVIAGCVQCAVYRKYAISINTADRPSSCGFRIQIIVTLLLIVEAILKAVLHDTSIGEKIVLGYHIFTCVVSIFIWCFSLFLIVLERQEVIPVNGRGHGIVLMIFWTAMFVKENIHFISWNSPWYWWHMRNDSQKISFSMWVVRYTLCLLLFVLGFFTQSVSRRGYISIESSASSGPGRERSDASTWKNVFIKMKMMLPFVWPKHSLLRQFLVLVCLGLLGLGRWINVLVPIYSKDIVDSVSPYKDEHDNIIMPVFRYDLVLLYGVFVFLRGGGSGTTGFLNNARTFLWIPVQQFTTRRVQIKFLRHLHNLSLRWHLERKTGEVLRVIDRGTVSMNTLLGYVLFNILPTVVDIIIAVLYFITAFNYIFGIIVFMCMMLYLGVTIWLTEWRTKYRRSQNKCDNKRNQTAVDSLLNFETVKYYGATDFEVSRYDKSIVEFQKAEWLSTASLNYLSALQNLIITTGLMAGSLLCVYVIVYPTDKLQLKAGDYVLFGTYIIQLYGPLNWLGSYYRMIQQAFIDMENMFELFEVPPEIMDCPGATGPMIKSGCIEFKDVSFYYEPGRQVLKNVSFVVPAGETYALVGHSGSGKSTIIRLLFRFYDVTSGSIKIDGQNISLVKQESLRKEMGVVPQDTVLFNNDIRYNIRYGNISADDTEVVNAADAANIHHRILQFPAGYDTVVGERGLKLSGGEKQRVAIARTILKNPAIVLLDEATSALDTKTERVIQYSLESVCKNRTTIIVAHRLSTIIHAHQILVMKDGEIIEKGRHEDLLTLGGYYTEMWNEQLFNHKDSLERDLIGSSSSNDSAEDAK